MNLKFTNKRIMLPLLCGIGCFILTFLLTKSISHDEGKSLETTSRNKKLLSNLEEIDLEIISLKKQILGAKEEISTLKSQKENLQLSLGVEIEETIETEDEEDVDLDLSLPEDEKDTSYYHYYEQEHSYSTYEHNENSNSIDNSSDSSLNYGNSPIIENNPEASVLTNQNLATLLFYLALYILIINIKHKWILVGITLGLGNIIRPEAPIILIAIFLFLIFRDFTDFRIIKKNILSFIGILFTFIIITKGASFLILKSGYTEYHLSNRDPLWKITCGLNPDTKGTYSHDDLVFLSQFEDRNEGHKTLITTRLDNPVSLLVTMASKTVPMWASNDTSYMQKREFKFEFPFYWIL